MSTFKTQLDPELLAEYTAALTPRDFVTSLDNLAWLLVTNMDTIKIDRYMADMINLYQLRSIIKRVLVEEMLD